MMKIVKTFGCKCIVPSFLFCYGIITGHICHRLKNNACLSLSLLFNVVADMWGKLIAANRLLIAVSPRPQNSNAEKKQE